MNIIVGITGASGAIYGIKLLQMLKQYGITTHLVISKAGKISMEHETGYDLQDVINMADYYHNNSDMTCCIASGSFITKAMVIAPCTAKTLSEIAYGHSNTLISRAADVTLKDRRKLILLFRETPVNLAHIKAMEMVTLMGGIIAPLVATFYHKPSTIDQMIDHQLGRILDLLDIENNTVNRWKQ